MSRVPSFPRLRPEVSVAPFSSSAKDETYLLLLPDGRSLQTTRCLYELITQLDGSRCVEEIAPILSGMWRCPVGPEEVERWIDRYVLPHGLLVPDSDQPPSLPADSSKPPPAKGILLIPDDLALVLTRHLRVLFHPLFCLPLLWTAFVCHILISAELQSGTTTGRFSSLPASAYLIGYLFALFSVLLHEFGHLSACQHFDCPHGEIRFGLYLLFPVFYANVSSAWRLERKARVVVDLGGIYFQLLLTIPACLLHYLTREPVWLLFVLELDAMILFCLNPFLRFDGYWLCSDLLGVPNLRSRSRLLMKILYSRIIGRPILPRVPLLDIRPAAALGVAVYALGTHFFGGLVIFFLCRVLGPRILRLPAEFNRLLQDGLDDLLRGETARAVVCLVQLLFLCLGVWAAGRLVIRSVRSATKASRHVLPRIRGFLRKGPRASRIKGDRFQA